MEKQKLQELLNTHKVLCDKINNTIRIEEIDGVKKIFFNLQKEHILLLQRLNIKNSFFINQEFCGQDDEYKITTDTKRQFGNSGSAWEEVADILQLPTISETDEDIYYSNETRRIAMLFLVELPVAYDVIMSYQSFEEKEYDITALRINSGYFSYQTAKNVILLLDIKNDLEQHKEFLEDKSFQRFYDFFINIRCDNPEDIFEETLDSFSFGNVSDMRKQNIKWLNYLFDLLIEINKINNNLK